MRTRSKAEKIAYGETHHYQSCIPTRYFGWYPVAISRYFTNRYQRQTRLVHFGIKKMAGAPFSQEEGGFGPLFVHFAPLLRKKGIPTEFFKKRVPGKSSKGVPAKACSTKIPTGYTNRPVLVIYQYRPGGGVKMVSSSLGNRSIASSYRYRSWQLQFWDTCFYLWKV